MGRIDPHSFMLACGTLYLAMPVTVWALLHKRHARLSLNLWCCSGLLTAATFILYSLRVALPGTLSGTVANSLGFASAALGAAALRLEAGRPMAAPALAALVVVATAATAWAEDWPPPGRLGLVNLLHGLVVAVEAHAAWHLAGLRASRSARAMAVLLAVFAAGLLLRALLLPTWLRGTASFTPTPMFFLTLLAAMGSCVVANIGFMGLALERARASAREQRSAMDELREQQRKLDLAARTREAVAGERARTTRLLAHEVRQPLHNAAVALQSGLATLTRSRDAVEVSRAIEQAQAVIRRVSATLDNTVAATALLASDGRISTVDADLQMLIALAIGDLPPEARGRVRIDYLADARSAQLEPSLVRLALRNLLANATLYSGPDTPVTLRVLDSDEPLALVLEVADLGPGIPESLRERIFDEGVRGEQEATVPGYGLGLHVVKRVARLHGGSIEWRPHVPQGSVFVLTLPQGDPG